MYTSIRRYEGPIPGRMEELIKKIEEGFLPLVSNAEGFINFRFIEADDGVIATLSTFETQAEAEHSNKMAASWVKENLMEFNLKPPQITAGKVRVDKSA